MYVAEGKEGGFTSIPTSIYWTIVTLTTVSYGDISPMTPLGQFIASYDYGVSDYRDSYRNCYSRICASNSRKKTCLIQLIHVQVAEPKGIL